MYPNYPTYNPAANPMMATIATVPAPATAAE